MAERLLRAVVAVAAVAVVVALGGCPKQAALRPLTWGEIPPVDLAAPEELVAPPVMVTTDPETAALTGAVLCESCPFDGVLFRPEDADAMADTLLKRERMLRECRTDRQADRDEADQKLGACAKRAEACLESRGRLFGAGVAVGAGACGALVGAGAAAATGS